MTVPKQRALRFSPLAHANIPPHAVVLFKHALTLDEEKDCDEWLGVSVGLHRELGLKPWDENVLQLCLEDEMPESYRWDERRWQSWQKAKRLRGQLISPT
jgi:hypothetical protein